MALPLKTLLSKLQNVRTRYHLGTNEHSRTEKTTGEETLESLLEIGGGSLGYNCYTALLYQISQNDPYRSLFPGNTIGDIVWTRSDTGVYLGTLEAAFNGSYLTWFCYPGVTNNMTYAKMEYLSNDQVQLSLYDLELTPVDGLQAFPIEIRVYNSNIDLND